MHDRLARGVIGNPFRVLVVAVMTAIGAAVLLSGFRIDGDFASLIPKDDPTLKLTRHLQGDSPPSRILLVVLRADDADRLEDVIPKVATSLDASEFLTEVTETREKFGGRAVRWFARAPLFALPEESLERLHARLTGPDRMEALQAGLHRMMDDPLAGKETFLKDPLGIRWIFDEAAVEATARFSGRLRKGSPYLISEDPPVAFVRATGRKESFNVDYSRRLIADVDERLSALPEGVDVRLAGGYVSALSHEASMRNDLSSTMTASSILILLFLTWFTRSFFSPFFLLVPVGLSILCALALGGAVLGPLTPLAVSVAAILVAQGIDFTIHSFARFGSIRANADRDEAVVSAQRSLGRPFLGAATTTMAAFLVLTLSTFPGLQQFGFLLFLGTLLCLISSLLFFPVLLLGADRFVRGTPSRTPLAIRGAHMIMRSRAALPVAGLITVVGLGSWIAVGLGKIPVDLNVRNTMAPGDPGLAVVAELEEDLGTSLYPVFALMDPDRSLDETRAAVRRLEDAGTLRAGKGLHELVPSEAKQQRIRRFRAATQGWVDATLADLGRLGVTAAPFRSGLEDLDGRFAAPPPSEAQLSDGEFADLRRTLLYGEENRRIVMLVPPAPLWNPEDRERFDAEVRAEMGEETPLYSAFHLPVHYADALKTDLARVAGLTAVAIAVLSVLVVGSLRDGLLALLPVMVATGVTLAGCALAGGSLNLLNMAAIPVILGIGVDDGIHFMSRFRELGRTDPERAILDVGPGIWGSTITTLLGFGSIAFCSTPGLQSMGLLVAVGATVAFPTTLLLLPTLLRKNSKAARQL